VGACVRSEAEPSRTGLPARHTKVWREPLNGERVARWGTPGLLPRPTGQAESLTAFGLHRSASAETMQWGLWSASGSGAGRAGRQPGRLRSPFISTASFRPRTVGDLGRKPPIFDQRPVLYPTELRVQWVSNSGKRVRCRVVFDGARPVPRSGARAVRG
jgi:hypothetical protein